MKKYLILTSIFALAACGGGGHHSGDDLAGFRSSKAAFASNQNITSMKSEILVGGDGTSIARSASVSRNGQEFQSYRLDDVDFKLAQNVSNNPSDAASFNFVLDSNGRIDTAIANVGGTRLNMVRDGDSKLFNGAVFEYVKDGKTLLRVAEDGNIPWAELQEKASDAGLTGGRWDRMEQRWEIVTSGGDTGLSYSDFGYLNTANVVKDEDITSASDLAAARDGSRTGANHQTFNAEQIRSQLDSPDYFMFAGGYEINSAPNQDMVFKGTAHGKVYSSIQADHHKDEYATTYGFNPSEDGNTALAFDTNNAELRYTAGATPTETLVMPFGTDGAEFYDVTVEKTGDTLNFAFDPKEGASDDTYIAQKYRKDAVETNVKKTANMGYYGVGDTQEAAGTVGYYAEKNLLDTTADELDDNAKHQFEFEAAYGMKRQ